MTIVTLALLDIPRVMTVLINDNSDTGSIRHTACDDSTD